ncbi:MAG: uroporphyrinogen-III synthase [Pseudomonadota bacterium]
MSRGPVLLTRPLTDSKRIADLLDEERIASMIWPLTKIVPVISSSPLPPGIDGLLITSAHGIRAFASLDPRRDLPVFCVGQRTSEVARGLGFAMVMNANGDGSSLARFAAGSPCRHFFYPRARNVTHDLSALLAPGGKRVSERVVYEAVPAGGPSAPVLAALKGQSFVVITLWSARNAEIFSNWIRNAGLNLDQTRMVAISQTVANGVNDLSFAQKLIACEPTSTSMLQTIREVVCGPRE